MKDFNTYINEKLIIKKDKLDKTENFVDLGLPSGTLWAKYNVGVDPSKLNKPEDWYGYYLQWGETTRTGNNYSLDNYVFGKNIDKYNDKDGLTELKLEDDAAYKYNKSMRMPTLSEVKELIEYTSSKSVFEHMDVKCLNGVMLTSNINNEQLFLPSGGFYDNECNLWKNENEGRFWISTSQDNKHACSIRSISATYVRQNHVVWGGDFKYLGFNVRGVMK